MDDDVVIAYMFSTLNFVFCGLNEPGGVLGGGGPKMCETRVLGVLGGYRGFGGV
jgi:hypothetical protein